MAVSEFAEESKWNKVKSQKARALLNMLELRGVPWEIPDTILVELDGEIPNPWAFPFDKIFVRECPVVPRHGVFESVLVKKNTFRDKIAEMREKFKKLEPDGCMLVQPFIQSNLSGVATFEGYMVVGKGHDGVTSGHGLQFVFPVHVGEDHYLGSEHYIKKGIKVIGENPDYVELEFVWRQDLCDKNCGKVFLTQIRHAPDHIPIYGSPIVGAVHGFINQGDITGTRKMVVKKIYLLDYDGDDADALNQAMLELERDIVAPEDGLLVCHPNGSLLSHAAAHCRGAGVSYMVGVVPVGTTITDLGGWLAEGDLAISDIEPYNPEQYKDSFFKGVKHAFNHWEQDWGEIGIWFHQFTSQPMNDPKITAFLGGVYVGWLLLAGTTIAIGEARHMENRCGGADSTDLSIFYSIVKDKITLRRNTI